MHRIFNAFYLSIFIGAVRRIFRKAVPEVDPEKDRKYIVAIPYGENYICGTFSSPERATRLAQKIEKLTNYHLDYGMTVTKYRLDRHGEVIYSIFTDAGACIMPPQTREIRKLCQTEGQDLRSTTI